MINTDLTVSDARHSAVNIHATFSHVRHDTPDPDVPTVRREVSNTQTIDSEVRSDIVNTRTTASDIHRDKLKSRDAGGRNQTVSITHTLATTELPLTAA